MKKISILGIGVHNVSLVDALNYCLLSIENKEAALRCKTVYTANSEMMVEALRDRDFENILLSGDLVIPDGIGLIKAAKFYKQEFKEKVAGIDLAFELIKELSKKEGSIFLLGGKSENTKMAKERVIEAYSGIKVAGYNDGYFYEEEEDEIVKKINESKPDFLLVCLGMKKQEQFIDKYKDVLDVGVAIGLGGTIDNLAGVSKRAPEFFVKNSLEWLYRLIKEPRRFFRMLNLPRFLAVAFADALYNRKNQED